MEKLAQYCGLSKETIRATEAGEQSPRAETLMRLARSLDVEVEDLLPDDWRTTYAPGAWVGDSGPGAMVRALAGRISPHDVSASLRRRDRTT